MRLYTFCNYYLSSIQQGIQSAHVLAEMFNKYRTARHRPLDQEGMLWDWSTIHKTMVVLNGGNSADIEDLYSFFFAHQHVSIYPFAKFHEDRDSLHGALTCVGIILPNEIYDTAYAIRNRTATFIENADEGCNLLWVESNESHEIITFSQFEADLIERLNQYGLAK